MRFVLLDVELIKGKLRSDLSLQLFYLNNYQVCFVGNFLCGRVAKKKFSQVQARKSCQEKILRKSKRGKVAKKKIFASLSEEKLPKPNSSQLLTQKSQALRLGFFMYI